jgi:hypothetical protein
VSDEEQFVALIDELLAEAISFDEFQRRFMDGYGYPVDRLDIPTRVNAVLAEVLESLTWTAETPTRFERKHGWITVTEFLVSLREARDLL